MLAAGRTPGSPPLSSFGPNMLLARRLLEKTESRTVRQYFDDCAKFRNTKFSRSETWKTAVRDGEAPDFGAIRRNRVAQGPFLTPSRRD